MNKIDVLLVYPPYTYPKTKQSPPIGLGYLGAILENKGCTVKILDMSAIGMTYDNLKKNIQRCKPSIVGISFMTNQFKNAVNVSKAAKDVDNNITVIAGGPHVSALPSEILHIESFDIAVIGEGELTISDLADTLLNNKEQDLPYIRGIAYKKNGSIYINALRPLIADLDSIPFPAWHLLPLDRYALHATGANQGKQVFAVIASRGCPNQCIFCDSHTIFGRHFRIRTAKNIFSELVYLNKNFGATQFDFVDDTVTVNKNRIYELCNLLLENKSNFKWMCNARVNTVDADMLSTMKKAGCARIEFGIESGDPEVLKNIKKGVTIEQIKNAHHIARQACLKIGSFVMVGNIGEDFTSVMKTRQLLKQIDTDDIYIAIATPFPGTELYRIARKNGWLLTTDWSRYVTSPTYLPEYQPVMKTDKMEQKQILKAFFYLHGQFAHKKFKTRYGKFFLLNSRFYRDNLLSVRSYKDIKHKIRLVRHLITSKL